MEEQRNKMKRNHNIKMEQKWWHGKGNKSKETQYTFYLQFSCDIIDKIEKKEIVDVEPSKS